MKERDLIGFVDPRLVVFLFPDSQHWREILSNDFRFQKRKIEAAFSFRNQKLVHQFRERIY
jgi:hypothetical protein